MLKCVVANDLDGKLLPQPHNSPDFAPSTCFLVPKLKQWFSVKTSTMEHRSGKHELCKTQQNLSLGIGQKFGEMSDDLYGAQRGR